MSEIASRCIDGGGGVLAASVLIEQDRELRSHSGRPDRLGIHDHQLGDRSTRIARRMDEDVRDQAVESRTTRCGDVVRSCRASDFERRTSRAIETPSGS